MSQELRRPHQRLQISIWIEERVYTWRRAAITPELFTPVNLFVEVEEHMMSVMFVAPKVGFVSR